MWAPRYWASRFWARRYWPAGDSVLPPGTMERHTDWARNIETGVPAGLATVAVKIHGTNTLSAVYEDDGVTLKTNPFVAAAATGVYAWCAGNGRYDETITPLEGEGEPYTNPDILLYNPGS